ncbi:MAG TPA: Hsp33 family molecular chaperone HslO [Clostridiaceae bacterium]|nr:Hsp33 family molecular chaperone HslO [Clostridiaceae bacterium]
MKDYIARAVTVGGQVRAFAAKTTDTVAEAARIHNLSPIASAALGRTLTAAAIMSKMLKSEKDTLTIQIKGDGPLGGVVVVSDAHANVRGYVHNPDVYLPLSSDGKLNVSQAIGRGYLNVIKDLGLKEPYIGYVKLVSGEIGEDIAYYFASSEQIPSAVSLGTYISPEGKILSAGGFVIQLLPEADEKIISFLEKKLQEIPPVSNMLYEGKTPEDILKYIFEGMKDLELKITEKSPCKYKCNCSRERMERNIVALGVEEIQDMIEEQEGAEVHCHFCNTRYWFDVKELERLKNEALAVKDEAKTIETNEEEAAAKKTEGESIKKNQ